MVEPIQDYQKEITGKDSPFSLRTITNILGREEKVELTIQGPKETHFGADPVEYVIERNTTHLESGQGGNVDYRIIRQDITGFNKQEVSKDIKLNETVGAPILNALKDFEDKTGQSVLGLSAGAQETARLFGMKLINTESIQNYDSQTRSLGTLPMDRGLREIPITFDPDNDSPGLKVETKIYI